MTSFIIDNYVVSKFMDNGIHIRSIKLETKLNAGLNIDSLHKITLGNKLKDNRLLQLLSDGFITFENLILFDI